MKDLKKLLKERVKKTEDMLRARKSISPPKKAGPLKSRQVQKV